MWRRVLSQSPTDVPSSAASQQQTRKYLDGWKALGALLHGGGSLSGHERNVCFMNTRGHRFADASSAIGFDHDSDSRAVVAVDWDGDGDLDLWTANRTAPRARYLQNNLDSEHGFLQLRLQGTTCNRDAIGARVDVKRVAEDDSLPIVRSVSAGEGFVSQTSKWLHFGLGEQSAIRSVHVTWPGGKNEEFTDVSANGRFLLVQGTGKAVPVQREQSPAFDVTSVKPASHDSARIVLGRRVPMPQIQFADLSGNSNVILLHGRPTLINLWATWCAPCMAELADWRHDNEALKESVNVFALNVDGLDGELPEKSIADAWKQIGFAATCGTIDPATFEMFEVIERTLLLQQAPLPIPTSFLIDGEGKLAVVYKGPVSAEQLLADAGHLHESVEDERDRAIPFSGAWYSSPFPPDLLAIPSQLVGLGRTTDAYEYIRDHFQLSPNQKKSSTWDQLGVTDAKLLGVVNSVARQLQQQNLDAEASEMYRVSLLYAPDSWNTCVQYSSLLLKMDHPAEGLALNKHMAQLKPNHPMPLNNAAWIYATTADASIRDPAKAVRLATNLCNATGNSEPSVLDTLAVAHAANGDFEHAVIAARNALSAAKKIDRPELIDRISQRLSEFEKALNASNGS
ncbi:MAG: ASPIC/UnbV domain-containing protein [Planctomycetales bacterium]|nr:ASPIC/UnbV domain-containing protein [Planctomycetales bacterium]